jgi:hypothetical protein
MAGKGSRPRPIVVPREIFDNNFDSIFGKPKPREQVVLDATAPPPQKQLPKNTFGPITPPKK